MRQKPLSTYIFGIVMLILLCSPSIQASTSSDIWRVNVDTNPIAPGTPTHIYVQGRPFANYTLIILAMADNTSTHFSGRLPLDIGIVSIPSTPQSIGAYALIV